MESSRNIIKKLKARQNRRKRPSVVMILKGDRERVRSLQKLIEDSTTSHSNNSGSSNSHELVIRSDMDNNNSDEERHNIIDYYSKGFMIFWVMFYGSCIFERTFHGMYLPPSNIWQLDESMLNQLIEPIIMLLAFWITLCYIRDLLVKDRREKLVLSRRGMMLWYFFGLVSAIYLCICLPIQYANFHMYDGDDGDDGDDRSSNNVLNYFYVLCLHDCRQSCHSGTNRLQLSYLIRKVSIELVILLFQISLAIASATMDQLSYTSILRYRQLGMLFAILTVAYSTLELTNKGRRERVKLRRWGMLWWFYHPYPDNRPFGTLTDIYGLVAAVFQCIFSMVQYACILLHTDNPIGLCLLPTIFLICLACSTSHQTHRTNKAISTERIFLLINIGLEILSATLEQLSSRSKPHYALYGMLLALAAVIISIWELVNKGKRGRVKWMKRGTWWWFYHPYPHYTPFGTVPDIYGLIGGITQCIFSTIQYVCYLCGVDNPIHFCLLPSIFYLCVAGSKMIGKSKTH